MSVKISLKETITDDVGAKIIFTRYSVKYIQCMYAINMHFADSVVIFQINHPQFTDCQNHDKVLDFVQIFSIFLSMWKLNSENISF